MMLAMVVIADCVFSSESSGYEMTFVSCNHNVQSCNDYDLCLQAAFISGANGIICRSRTTYRDGHYTFPRLEGFRARRCQSWLTNHEGHINESHLRRIAVPGLARRLSLFTLLK